jgi:hypothetical protein
MVLLHDTGQSLAHLLVHAIFSSKDRRPSLHAEEIRNEIYLTSPRAEAPDFAKRLD